ncbi:MAG: glutathione S-transferase N-terminal domain-containing protein, partial [Caulobacterales bacterium]|nr:glutathione S-transferase N-terminal domain-containing protein [Caulobacterales bacterium]
MTGGLVLHDFPRSSACFRVRIALGLKGLAYESRLVDFRKNAQRSDAYLTLSPAGLVPVLEHEGRVITQSMTIMRYLDRLAPEPRLLPDDSDAARHVEEFALAIACDIHPL